MTRGLRRSLLRRADRSPVSVVVVVTDDNAVFLPECLAALTPQGPTEILLVVTGTGRDTSGVVAGAAAELRRIDLPEASLAGAFNAGAAEASESRLVLVTAGDRLRPDSLDGLSRTGFDVVGAGLLGIGIASFDTEFWRRSGLSVEDGPWDHYQPQVDAALAGATAASLDRPLRKGPRRGTGSGFLSVPRLAAHIEQWAELVRRGAGLEGLAGWLLASEAPRFLTDAESCTPSQWESLCDAVALLASHAKIASLPVEARVQVHLALSNRQEDLATFNAARWQDPWFPTRTAEGRTYAVLPVEDVPEDLLLVDPAKAPNQSGPRAEQHRLRLEYAALDLPVDPGLVYFQSYRGAVTDNPLAIHEELRRRRPDLRTVWAVNRDTPAVPEGAEPVLIGSREWYVALATAGSLVTNVDLDSWFVKRPGQRVLQSYHGYPSKAMGLMAWESKGFTPLRVERQLSRSSRTWDLLLTPSPEMDVHYREQYRYEGPILAAGLPRDDVLVGPDADRIRDEVRQRLGIEGRTAVLYAPTWRDDLATGYVTADLASAFDVERAAGELGDDYVLLLRGHRFHQDRPAPGPELAGRLLDVTDHEEINELILAADAAVFDYSSLRFHFGLTGRPMVFLVPDLDRYAGRTRGFLFDFADSAPGPRVDDTGGVVAALRDLPVLAEAYRDDYARFRATYLRTQDGHASQRAVEAFFGDGELPSSGGYHDPR